MPCLCLAASLLQLEELLLQAAILPMAVDEHANEQADDGQRHQADDHQLYVSYLGLFLFCLKQVDVMFHVLRVDLKCFALVEKSQTVPYFRGTESLFPVAHLLVDVDTQLRGRQRHIDGVAPGKSLLIVVLHEASANHHLMEVGGIELVWLVLADAVVFGEIAVESLAVTQSVGDDATVAQHTAFVHRILQHLLGQAVETCHRFCGTRKTERLCQREI